MTDFENICFAKNEKEVLSSCLSVFFVQYSDLFRDSVTRSLSRAQK